jgi:hypothetical protein
MLNQRRIERHRARGEAECALRVLEGEQVGLSTRWRHGRSRLTPKHISHTPYLWQLRLPNLLVDSIEIDVVSLDPSPTRPALRQAWSVNPGLQVVGIQTATATLAWALPRGQVDWAISRVTRET